MTPDQVHYGQAELVHASRQKTLDHAFRANPIRFVNKAPEPPQTLRANTDETSTPRKFTLEGYR